MRRRMFGGVIATMLMVCSLLAASFSPADARGLGRPVRPPEDLLPVIFVHGGAGSGAQFQTQALRLASNGYPAEYIDVLEYDSLFGINTMEDVHEALDAKIEELLESTGAEQVDLLGHSLGTRVSQQYLTSSPERAARVAHYVNLDGGPAPAPPGGVDTLAVWGAGNTERRIVGGENVYFSDQTHTEVVTSRETFEAIFEFFRDEKPVTLDIVPQPSGRIEVSGRAQLFPQNSGVADATLDIYRISDETGARIGKRPVATFTIAGDGSWGPFKAKSGVRYEFALTRDGGATHHFYFEPFMRTDRLVRLLTSEPGGGLSTLLETSPEHQNLVIMRNKEWWGDQANAADNDVVRINGQNILNAANAPINKRVIAMFVMDRGTDGVTDLSAPLPTFFGLPFMTGMDVHIPASIPPDGVTEIEIEPRRAGGVVQEFRIPNWASTEHAVTINVREAAQEIDTFPEYARSRRGRK